MTEETDDYSRLLKKAQNLGDNKPTLKKGGLIGKKQLISRKRFVNARKLKPKKNNAEFLVNIICLKLFKHIWKYQTLALKYKTKGYNKKRANFRKFLTTLSNVYYKHKYYIDKEIFEFLQTLPPRPGVEHDFRFWKLRLVNNEVLDTICQKRLKFWAQLHYVISANRSIYQMTISAVNNMKIMKKEEEFEEKEDNEAEEEEYEEEEEEEEQ
jgi:hypothetical protein